jgi:hypothetical protein
MTGKPLLRRSSACNTPNGADAAVAAPPVGAADDAEDAASPGVLAAAAEAAVLCAGAEAAAWDGGDLDGAVPAAAAAAACHGAPASSARLARIPIALTDGVRHGLTNPGEPRFVCGASRVVRGLRFAAGRGSTQIQRCRLATRGAARHHGIAANGEYGFQWRS